MFPLMLAAGMGLAVLLWLRGVYANRKRWLRRLSLPGVWQLDGDAAAVLEFRDGLAAGRYAAQAKGETERGAWRLAGHSLLLTPDGGNVASYELRLFENGAIGIHGPGRERQVFVRRHDNVVQLKGRG